MNFALQSAREAYRRAEISRRSTFRVPTRRISLGRRRKTISIYLLSHSEKLRVESTLEFGKRRSSLVLALPFISLFTLFRELFARFCARNSYASRRGATFHSF